ncbi:hypothetical protein VNO80_29242 [Phaseolus coccineus]|uniref:Uncharacterized protein n=1 Tax=Phaseolus coccineus TaxID=3886 RepID=A0AAN9LAI6_PHACN
MLTVLYSLFSQDIIDGREREKEKTQSTTLLSSEIGGGRKFVSVGFRRSDFGLGAGKWNISKSWSESHGESPGGVLFHL